MERMGETMKDEHTVDIPLDSEEACVYLFGEAGKDIWQSLQNNPMPTSQCTVTGVDVVLHAIYYSS